MWQISPAVVFSSMVVISSSVALILFRGQFFQPELNGTITLFNPNTIWFKIGYITVRWVMYMMLTHSCSNMTTSTKLPFGYTWSTVVKVSVNKLRPVFHSATHSWAQEMNLSSIWPCTPGHRNWNCLPFDQSQLDTGTELVYRLTNHNWAQELNLSSIWPVTTGHRNWTCLQFTNQNWAQELNSFPFGLLHFGTGMELAPLRRSQPGVRIELVFHLARMCFIIIIEL